MSKVGVLRSGLLVLVLPIAGCAHTTSHYRVIAADVNPEDASGLDPPLLIVPPATRLEPLTGHVTIDVFNVVDSSLRCDGLAFDDEALRGATVWVWHNGKFAAALRIRGGMNAGEPFADRPSTTRAWRNWWKSAEGSPLSKCLDANAGNVVWRALHIHRPMRAAEALEAQFGFDPRVGQRSVVLRPGMKVCASEVEPNAANDGLRPAGGETCTRLVQDPRGGTMFDATTGRIGQITAGGAWAPSTQLWSVASWAEVPRAPGNPQHFVLIHPQQMPVGPVAPPGPGAGNRALIVAVDAGVPAALRIVRQCARETPNFIATLCSRGVPFPSTRACVKEAVESGPPGETVDTTSIKPICFKVGDRTVITTEFTVFANGHPMDVGVGTTVGDLIERVAPDLFSLDLIGSAPPAAGTKPDKAEPDGKARLARILQRIRLERIYEGTSVLVDTLAMGAAAHALPLQPGDRLTW